MKISQFYKKPGPEVTPRSRTYVHFERDFFDQFWTRISGDGFDVIRHGPIQRLDRCFLVFLSKEIFQFRERIKLEKYFINFQGYFFQNNDTSIGKINTKNNVRRKEDDPEFTEPSASKSDQGTCIQFVQLFTLWFVNRKPVPFS